MKPPVNAVLVQLYFEKNPPIFQTIFERNQNRIKPTTAGRKRSGPRSSSGSHAQHRRLDFKVQLFSTNVRTQIANLIRSGEKHLFER